MCLHGYYKYTYVFIIPMKSYNTKNVALITGLSSRQIDHWDSTHLIKPSVSEASGYGSVRLYSSTDLVLFRVAKALIDVGVDHKKITKVVNHLKLNISKIEPPLFELKFITNCESIFVITKDSKTMIDILRRCEVVFAIALGEIMERLEHDILTLNTNKEYKVKVRGQYYKVLSQINPANGKYQLTCPLLAGISSEGNTIEESLQMIKAVISQKVFSTAAHRSIASMEKRDD